MAAFEHFICFGILVAFSHVPFLLLDKLAEAVKMKIKFDGGKKHA